MYSITREDAASKLNISTRSIDRYIKAGKLRSKKEGKIVYIHQDDIDNFSSNGGRKQEVILNQQVHHTVANSISKQPSQEENTTLQIIFHKLREDIKNKDEEIKDLSIKLGKMEEVVKNSISMIEFKKNQFLLEESKNNLIGDLESTKKELNDVKKVLKEEKNLNYMLIGMSVVLFLVLVIIWLVKI